METSGRDDDLSGECCPLCRQAIDWPELRLVENVLVNRHGSWALSRKHLRVVAALLKKPAKPERLIDEIYWDDPTGGPEGASLSLRVTIYQINRRLKHLGWRIANVGSTGGALYALQPTAVDPRPPASPIGALVLSGLTLHCGDQQVVLTPKRARAAARLLEGPSAARELALCIYRSQRRDHMPRFPMQAMAAHVDRLREDIRPWGWRIAYAAGRRENGRFVGNGIYEIQPAADEAKAE